MDQHEVKFVSYILHSDLSLKLDSSDITILNKYVFTILPWLGVASLLFGYKRCTTYDYENWWILFSTSLKFLEEYYYNKLVYWDDRFFIHLKIMLDQGLRVLYLSQIGFICLVCLEVHILPKHLCLDLLD